MEQTPSGSISRVHYWACRWMVPLMLGAGPFLNINSPLIHEASSLSKKAMSGATPVT